MTGTWRDTLFVWKGKIRQCDDDDDDDDGDNNNNENNNKEARTKKETAISWTGTWVGCDGCPDAQTAPTPNNAAFEESTMHFQVSGTGNGDPSNNFWRFELADGSGWDLGEQEDKQRHKDHTHTVLMKFLPWQYRESVVGDTVVVAVGENDFGSFVSAGFIEEEGSHQLVLGRRYLGDRDPRAKWSVQDLYERVSQTDTGNWYVVIHNVWYEHHRRVRTPPWRTIYLQAKTYQEDSRARKRKRGEEEGEEKEESCRVDLNIPTTQEFSSKLMIHDETKPHALTSNVRYVEQCSGCGKYIHHCFGLHGQTQSCIEVMEYTEDEPNRDIGFARYCSPQCVRKKGAPDWAKACKEWAREFSGTGYFLKSLGESYFWHWVWEDEEARKVMQDAGWHKSGFDFNLNAEQAGEIQP